MFIPLLAALFFLLAVIFFLITTVIDATCREVFERVLVDVPPKLYNVTALLANMNLGVPLTVNSVVNGLRQCSQGVDSLSVVQQLGINTSSYDLPTILGQQYDNLNLTQMVVSLNLP